MNQRYMIEANLRPGWLADDQAWKAQLSAMTKEDIDLINTSWQLAEGSEPAPDLSWLTFEPEQPVPGSGIFAIVVSVTMVAFAISWIFSLIWLPS